MVSIMCTGMRIVRAWIGDGAGDGLANPPRGVGRELVAAAVFELVHRLHQADVALLNQVEELQAAVGVLFGDGDDQAQVGFDQLALGLLGVHVALDHLALGALQLGDRDARVGLDLFQIGLAVLLLAAVLLLQLLALRWPHASGRASGSAAPACAWCPRSC
jgi:hypothetical protein